MDVFTALSGGVGALYGPLHGGANEVAIALEKAALSGELIFYQAGAISKCGLLLWANL